jgi:hypothetical protein
VNILCTGKSTCLLFCIVVVCGVIVQGKNVTAGVQKQNFSLENMWGMDSLTWKYSVTEY